MNLLRHALANRLAYLFGLLAVLTFASVIYYQNTGLKLHFFHESAFPLLYAESNLQTGSLYDPSFIGREISPISWPAFGSLVLVFFDGKVSMAAHVLYAMSFSFSFLIAAIWYVRQMKFQILSSFIFIALLFTTFTLSPTRYGLLDQVWVWPMNSYGVQDLFALICTVLLFKFISSKENFSPKRSAPSQALFVAFITFTILGFNGVRGLLMVGGGLIVGLIVDYFVQNQKNLGLAKEKLVLPIVLILASGVGVLINWFLYSDVPQPFQTSHTISTLTEGEDLGHRLSTFFWGWLKLFGAIPISGTSVFTLENVFLISKFALALALLVIVFVKIVNVKMSSSVIERVLTYRLAFVFFVTLTAAIFADTAGIERYLIPLQFGIIFLIPFWTDKIILENRKKLIFAVSLVLLPLMAFSIIGLSRFDSEDYKSTELYKLSMYLKANELNYGFFTPWHSDALVINQFSDGEVRVQPIDVDAKGLIQHSHSNSLLFDSALDKEFFILIPRRDLESFEQLRALSEQAIFSEDWGSWKIFRFKADAFSSVIEPAYK